MRHDIKNDTKNFETVRRGDIFCADMNPIVGSEQGGIRPVLIVQNDLGNMYSPTTIVVALTSKQDKKSLPTHIHIGTESGLNRDSMALCEQIRTIDKTRLISKIGSVNEHTIKDVLEGIKISFNIA